jgi:protein-S-isoprenylcysteine O-methyltransferase Ste14
VRTSEQSELLDKEDAANVRIFPPAVPLLTIVLGLGLNRAWPISLGIGISEAERYWLGGLIIVGAILGLGLWSVLLFRRGGQSENPWKPTIRIVDRGPFRFTRNPMYLQMVLVCIGVATILLNYWILVLTPVCGWVLHRFAILPEEAYLEEKFGEPYISYKDRVRRWL